VSPHEPHAAVVERLLRKPPQLARAELCRLLDVAKTHKLGTRAHEVALDANAHLITDIRVRCASRNVKPPWLQP
jgi:hypothetical protein